ncbi:MAG: flagellar hook-basal body complex protein [Clostridiales bacterium]|nr:flagellar hook-basal body complex protein [Clostridiales bacterium]
MNRAMFSGVAGLKVHQTRMDVIGNNIANVNTYGYKSQRAVFSDIFYQTLRGASMGTNSRGGVNPSTVGYGAMLAGIQNMMTQSSMQNTGYGLDVAITGEGFLQVMDADGNVFYTRAGMLDFDSVGNLVDINGNFVLGSRDLNGTDGTQKINLVDPLGSVNSGVPTSVQRLNGLIYTLTGSSNSKYGNVSVNFASDKTMGFNDEATMAKAKAVVNATGTIDVKLNAYATFTSLDELNKAINDAIVEAVKAETGESQHIAGDFKLTVTEDNGATFDPFKDGPLTGAEIVGSNFSVKPGVFTGIPNGGIDGFNIKEVNTGFTGVGDLTEFKVVYYDGSSSTPPYDVPGWEVYMKIIDPDTSEEKEYICFVPCEAEDIGSALLMMNKDPMASGSDTFTVTFPGFARMNQILDTEDPLIADGDEVDLLLKNGINPGPPSDITVTASEPSKELGLGSVNFSMQGATEGGAVTPDQLTGITIGADGAVYVSHAEYGTVAVGKIMLANFANPRGLQQVGSNYYKETPNSGPVQYADPGSDGTGALKASTLEMSNVDLSDQFVDMIVTQRGFQANSRVITVSDTLLEELINLKR